MNGRENEAELAIMSVVMILLSLGGIVAGFSKGLFGSIDGLLIMGIALMILLVFSILLVVQARQQGWIGSKHHAEAGNSGPATAK